MLEHDAHELGLTLDDIRNWQPPAGDDPATGEDVTMREAHQRTARSCRSGSARATSSSTCPRASPSPRRRSTSTSSRPQLADCFDDALGLHPVGGGCDQQQGVLPARQLRCGQVALHGGAAPAACSTTPPCGRRDDLAKVCRQARLGRGQEVPARAVPHDRRPQHGVGHPGRLRRSRHAASPRLPRCRASTWPTRSSRTPCSTASGSGDEKFFEDLNQGNQAAGGSGWGKLARAGTPPGSRPPWRPRPPARSGPGWSATWCSTSSPPSRGSPRARTKPTSISTWA